MSPQQIVAVALRVFAAWLCVDLFRTLPVLSFARRGDAPGFLFVLVFFGLTGLLVLVLWFFPRTIAGKLLSAPVSEPTASISPDTWLAIGCALIGLWMLASTLPRLVAEGFTLYQASSDPGYRDQGVTKSWAIYYVVEVAIALWLILGARGFRKVFWWARYAGLTKPSA